MVTNITAPNCILFEKNGNNIISRLCVFQHNGIAINSIVTNSSGYFNYLHDSSFCHIGSLSERYTRFSLQCGICSVLRSNFSHLYSIHHTGLSMSDSNDFSYVKYCTYEKLNTSESGCIQFARGNYSISSCRFLNNEYANVFIYTSNWSNLLIENSCFINFTRGDILLYANSNRIKLVNSYTENVPQRNVRSDLSTIPIDNLSLSLYHFSTGECYAEFPFSVIYVDHIIYQTESYSCFDTKIFDYIMIAVAID